MSTCNQLDLETLGSQPTKVLRLENDTKRKFCYFK